MNVAQLKASQTRYYSVKSTNQAAGSNYLNDGATGTDALAAGVSASATKTNAIAIGTGAQALADNAISIGTGNVVRGARSGAFGDPSIINGADSYSVGNNNRIGSTTNNAFALGNNVYLGANAAGVDTVSVSGAVALGNASGVTVQNGVALGAGSISNRIMPPAAFVYVPAGVSRTAVEATVLGNYGAVSVGTGTGTRQIVNVAAGTIDTDAVNVAQLKAVSKQAADGAVHYYSVKSINQAAGSNYLNDGATGTDALAAGVSASAAGNYATAVGRGATAAQTNATAIGHGASASNSSALALGYEAKAGGQGAVALGDSAKSTGQYSMGLGYLSNAEGSYSVALGREAKTTTAAMNGVAIGRQASVTGQHALALGYLSSAELQGIAAGRNSAAGIQGIAIGTESGASATNALALGTQAKATAEGAAALGLGANATVTAGIALGTGSLSDRLMIQPSDAYVPAGVDRDAVEATVLGTYGAVSVGTGTGTRQIINVAAGSADTDAVNVAQLKAVATAAGSQTYAFSISDNQTPNNSHTVTLGQTMTPNIQFFGVAGQIVTTVEPTDAGGVVTIGLHPDILEQIGQGGNWNLQANGDAPTAEVGSGDTVQFLDGDNIAITRVGRDVTIATKPDVTFDRVTITGGPVLSNSGIDMRNTKLTNVAPGIISETSTDGVNASQLYGVANSTATHLGGGSTVNKDGTISAPTYNVGGKTYHNVGDAFNATNSSITNIYSNLGRLKNEIAEAGASSAALAGLQPLQYDPMNRSQLMVSGGYYRDKYAFALGLAYHANEDTLWHVGLAVGQGDNHVMANLGATWRLGDRSKDQSIPERYRKGPISSVYVMQQENIQLQSQVQTLTTENAEIRTENAGIRAENAEIKAENAEIKAQLAAIMKKLNMK